MRRFIILLSFITGFAVFIASGQPKQSGYVVVKLGNDTIAVEEFSMSAGELHGTSGVRAPKATIRNYSADFNPDGTLKHFEMTSQRIDNPVNIRRNYEYAADSVRVSNQQDTTTSTYAVAATDHPFPLFVDMFGPWQAALQLGLKDKEKGFGILAGKKVMHYEAKGAAPGTVDLLNEDFGPFHATIGENGMLEKFDMTETTDKFVAERVPSLDVLAITRSFADRERSGKTAGPLSPRDTVRASVNGASIKIDYGRPSARGRAIFGKVVPWNTVWRTGANAATQLTTDKDITIGETVVPAGTYTLFTLPREDGWMLIINKQHGQWGTAYDEAKDLARVPLTIKHLDQPVEKFTFDITGDGSNGVLSYRWENTEASIAIKVH